MRDIWWIGAILAVFASFMSTFGLNVQKFSYNQKEKINDRDAMPYYLDCLWWAGFCLILFGTIVDVVALAFAAQSLIAPLAGMSLVFNIMIAPCFLEEIVTRWDVLATGIILLGCTIAVTFADHTNTNYNFDDIVDKANSVACWCYFIIALITLVLTYILINRFEGERIDQSTWYLNFRDWHPVAYAFLAANAGAISVTCAKAAAELVKSEIRNDTQESSFKEHWFAAPMVLVVLVASMVIQIHYLNLGLARFEVLLVVSIYQGFWIILTSTAGMVTYTEYESFGLLESFLFPLGVSITLYGVYLMSQRPSDYSIIKEQAPMPVQDEANKKVGTVPGEETPVLPRKSWGGVPPYPEILDNN